jgi:hypothetical protein
MLTMDFRPGPEATLKVERGIRLANTLAQIGGPRYAVEAMLNVIGVSCPPRDENYYREALDYYLGLAYAHDGQPELAIDHLHRSGVLPSSGGDQIFESHVAESLLLHSRMQSARERGLPTFLLASMPRSASVSFTQSIAGLLDIPVIRVSVGEIPNYQLVPNWLNLVSPGGAILHDHFSATKLNIETMKRGGVKKVMVLVRDPRAAAASFARLSGTHSKLAHEQMTLTLLADRFVPWLAQWLTAARIGEVGIKWISSDAVRSNTSAVWNEITQMFVEDYPALGPHMERSLSIVRANYQHGDDQRWRQEMSPVMQEQMWAAIPSDIIDEFGLLP